MCRSPSDPSSASPKLSLQQEQLTASFSRSLERHRAVFATVEEHLAQMTDLAHRCMASLNLWCATAKSAVPWLPSH
jgi:hypothetical protein